MSEVGCGVLIKIIKLELNRYLMSYYGLFINIRFREDYLTPSL